MPLQVDHSRPIRTVDTFGKVISTDTADAAPMKRVDSVGRAVAEAARAAESAIQAGIKSEASSVAEKAADGLNLPGAEPKDEKITEAKIRREYLEAQRIKRQAQEYEKKAKGSLDKAKAFDDARALAENGEDPTAILKAAGLDVVKFYQHLTNYALSDKGKQEETDPVKKELADHKARLEKYAKDLEERDKTTREREETAAHNQVIQGTVVPMLQANQEKYETLLMHYGQNAAIEVYKNVWEIYQQTGKARSFQDVADEMEKYWAEQVESGITKALSLKRFANRYTQAEQTPGRPTTPSPSFTLSNRQQSPTPPSNPYRGMTKEERVAAILKRFDGK